MSLGLKPIKIFRAVVIATLVLLPYLPGVQIGVVAGGVLAILAGGVYLYDAYTSAQKIEQAHDTLQKLSKGELPLDRLQAGEDGLHIEDDEGNITTIT